MGEPTDHLTKFWVPSTEVKPDLTNDIATFTPKTDVDKILLRGANAYFWGSFYGFPKCCVEWFHKRMLKDTNIPDDMTADQIKAMEFLKAKRTREAWFGEVGDDSAADSYIDGFLPCKQCTAKILSGDDFTSIVKRPWRLANEMIYFSEENECLLKKFFEHIEKLGLSPSQRDVVVADKIVGTSFNDPYNIMNKDDFDPSKGIETISKMFQKKYSEAKVGCANRYSQRFAKRNFDRREDILKMLESRKAVIHAFEALNPPPEEKKSNRQVRLQAQDQVLVPEKAANI